MTITNNTIFLSHFSDTAVAVDSLCLACGCGIMMWSGQSQIENAELASSCRGGRSPSAVFPWGDEILVVPVRIQECKLIIPVGLVVGSRKNSRGSRLIIKDAFK